MVVVTPPHTSHLTPAQGRGTPELSIFACCSLERRGEEGTNQWPDKLTINCQPAIKQRFHGFSAELNLALIVAILGL